MSKFLAHIGIWRSRIALLILNLRVIYCRTFHREQFAQIEKEVDKAIDEAIRRYEEWV